jgi:hypothetical protein
MDTACTDLLEGLGVKFSSISSGQVATAFYFIFFMILLPFFGFIEALIMKNFIE